MPFTKTGEYIFDRIDLKILKMFADLNGKSLDGWDMMMRIYPNAKVKSQKDNSYAKMKKRIEHISKLGVIELKEKSDGTPIWETSDDKVCFRRLRMSTGTRNFVGVFIDDRWNLMQVD